MSETHAQTARRITASAPNVLAYALRDATQYRDFTALNRLLPGVDFTVYILGRDHWEVRGVCQDRSVIHWDVGE